MIHSYFTSGMFNLAEIFLKSLHYSNGNDFNVVLSTRDLDPNQINKLEEIYPGVNIENKKIDMQRLADKAELPVALLNQYRDEVEHNYVSKANKVWKLMIAADDRVKALQDVIQRAGANDVILHFDIDTLFKKDIHHAYKFAAYYDGCLLLRLKHNIVKARITISTMFWKKTRSTLQFFDRWINYVDAIHPLQRPIGYGQTACYYAFIDMRDYINICSLGNRWGLPGQGHNRQGNFVWSGAIHKMTKYDCVKYFNQALGS